MENDDTEQNFQIPYPHPKQMEVLKATERFQVLNWGRRTGKSMIVAMLTMLRAIETQGNYYIIAPTYRQAKSIYWNDIIKQMIPGAIIEKTDEGELYVQFATNHYQLDVAEILGYDIDVTHDKNKPPSRIYLKGADNPDSLRGVALDGAVMDELAFMRDGNYVWRKIIRPALGDRTGWAIFSSTPDGVHNIFYEFCRLAQRPDAVNYRYSHATALDNPYFPKQEWVDTKKEYEQDGKLEEWVAEWEAEFTIPGKLVYRAFSQETHVVSPLEVPKDGTYCIGMDFGTNHPFACLFIIIDREGNWYIYDEIYERDLTVDDEYRLVTEKMGENHFTRIIGDHAAKGDILSLRAKKLWVTKSIKGDDSIKAGIRLIKGLLAIREGTGKPKLYVSSNCKNTIREFESYSYLKDAWGEISDVAEKRNDDAMDALRYVVLSQANKAEAPKKAPKRYTESGRLVS